MKFTDLSNKNEKNNELAIVGIDCRMGDADSLQKFWEGLKNGEDFVSEIDPERKKIVLNIAREMGISDDCQFEEMGYMKSIDKFDFEFFGMTRKEASLLDPSQKMLLQSVYKCLEDSNHLIDHYYGSFTGVFVGYDDSELVRYRDVIYRYEPEMYGMAIPGNHTALLAGRISDYFNFSGPAYVVNTACSSSMSAFHLACQSVLNEECDQAIVGAINYTLFPLVKENTRIGIESTSSRTRAFDYRSDGTGKGEGIVTLLIKRKEDALFSGDSIYAMIKKTLTGHDGKASSLTSPNMNAQADLLKKCWEDKNVSTEDLVYIECHGTGTKIGDPIEIAAINDALGKHIKGRKIGLGSLKSNIGHLNSAAGLASIVKACMVIKNHELVPSIHYTFPNWNIDFLDIPFYVTKTTEKIAHKNILVGVNSFGLSGTNCHVILGNLEESVEAYKNNEYDTDVFLLVLSAKSKTSLINLCNRYFEFLDSVLPEEIINVCYTAAVARKHLEYRAAFMGKNKIELQKKIITYLAKSCEVPKKDVLLQEDIMKGSLVNRGKECIVNDIATAYVNGQDIDWELCYGFNSIKRVHIPTYCFDEVDCWYDFDKKQMKYKFYRESWNKIDIQSYNSVYFSDLVVFYFANSLSNQIIERLKNDMELNYTNLRVINVEDSFEQYCKEIEKLGKKVSILYLGIFNDKEKGQDISINYSLFYVYRLYRNLMKNGHEIEYFIYIGNDGIKRGDQCHVNAFVGAGYEFVMGLSDEARGMKIKCIDINSECDLPQLSKCINDINNQQIYLINNGCIYSRTYEETDSEATSVGIEDDDVIVVFGGFSENALHLCLSLSKKNRVEFYLISRSTQKHLDDSKVTRIINRIKENGCSVKWHDCDVSDKTQVAALVGKFIQDNIQVSGIINCAGIETKGIIANKSEELIKDVIGSKVMGTYNIDLYFKTFNCKFYVAFSSLASIVKSVGQADYAYANKFMDLYVSNMGMNFKKRISICWPGFRNSGMAKRNKVNFDTMITVPLRYRDIEICFTNILQNYDGNVIVLDSRADSVLQEFEENGQEKQNLKKVPKDSNDVQRELTNIWKKIIGMDIVNADEDFYSLGGNSISAINLLTEVEKVFGIKLEYSFIDNISTINEMVGMISNRLELDICSETNLKTEDKSKELLVKKLEGVKPFNYFLFINCYYNSLLTVLQYYKVPINNVLLSAKAEVAQNGNSVVVNYKFANDSGKILEEYGIQQKSINSGKLISRIQEAIDNKHFIILDVDCYYLSIRKDFYHKKHYIHTLLVYGYTLDLEQVVIMEQKNAESLSYQENIIPYKELEKAYCAVLHSSHWDNSIEIWSLEKNKSYYEVTKPWNSKDICFTCSKIINDIKVSSEMTFDDVLKTLNNIINYFKIELFISKDNTIIQKLVKQFNILRIKMVRDKVGVQECIEKMIELLELN